VRIFTTAGDASLAMSRKVEAEMGPVSGALFIGGAATVWALEVGAMSRRDAMIMPTSTDISTIGSE
jgi:hypothetical protein